VAWVNVGGINVEVADGWTTSVGVAIVDGMVDVGDGAGEVGLLVTGVFTAEIKIS